ncbi:MAG: DNA/RNA non-specific endonuclease, partial [Phaeodactylibacter sp.]|nr:DNA/RNA non-specific endonuclease [Phaeodactylibacter sp.]
MSRSFILLLLCCPLWLVSQNLDEELRAVEGQLEQLERQKTVLLDQLEDIKLQSVQRDLRAIGLPSENYIMHQAMALQYAEAHEQAAWVAHIILPDVTTGSVGRTNDFRVDPKVETGTAVEADYFLKYLQPDSSYK